MATVVAFHAHPDDEALLTGGTLARLAAEGHRVVIVAATDGVVHAAPAPGCSLIHPAGSGLSALTWRRLPPSWPA